MQSDRFAIRLSPSWRIQLAQALLPVPEDALDAALHGEPVRQRRPARAIADHVAAQEDETVVVVTHGFSRRRLNMAGWGGLLSSNGFIVAVPDLPAWSNHERNGQAIRELRDRITSKTLVTEPAPNGDAALMGFSVGGRRTLLAAAINGQVRCWVGLDPVDSGQKGAEAAKQLQVPCAVLLAEPSRCNADGNARQMVAGLPGPLFALQVRTATHTDLEQPTDWLAELVYGKADPDRRAIFERYTVAVLKSVFFGDAPSLATLATATNDAGVMVLSTRAINDFKP